MGVMPRGTNRTEAEKLKDRAGQIDLVKQVRQPLGEHLFVARLVSFLSL